MQESRLFHESWYRISAQRICLRSSIKIHRQLYRGSTWYVLSDPFSSQFFRLRPAAYRFIMRLSLKRTVEEVWKEIVSEQPDDAPGQEDVINLLAQLYHANLLHYTLPPDSAKLFERFKKQQQKTAQSTIMNIMFIRIPLFDPDNLLKRLLPILRLLISPLGAIIWLAVMVLAGKVAIDNFSALGVQSQGIIAPGNIPLLYLAFILIKALHEFGHSFAVRRFGGQVHTMGIMFLIFNPIPYMDATAAWAFRSKWKRVFVGASGMIFELFVAALALFIWANTGQGVLHSLAYNVIFVASVSTILFNINPLLRFDGYYILSDLLDIPNLHSQASQHLRHLVERYAFGYKKSHSPATGLKDATLLTTFGILSGIYRLIVFTTILLFVADRFLLAGIIMVVVCVVSWVVVPIFKLIRYLATEPRLERTRKRAVFVCLAAAALVFTLLYLIPFPQTFTSPGVLEAGRHVLVSNKTAGEVDSIVISSGEEVKAGDTLVILKNRELDFRIMEMEAKISETRAMSQQAMRESLADVKPLASLLSSITERLTRLQEEKKNLEVKAEFDGVWIAPQVEDYNGMWLHRGTPLGRLVNAEEYFFSSVIAQQEVSAFFSDDIHKAEVKISGEAQSTIAVTDFKIIPVEQTALPSAALGFAAGGELAIDVADSSGIRVVEPFYEVRLSIVKNQAVRLLHGRTGFVRFELPRVSLLKQWWRKLSQLIQKRYQL